MSDTEIIIKGEIHTSSADLEDEREILKQGVDHLILEGVEDQNWNVKWTQLWYAWTILIFQFLFARHVYVDNTILRDIAEIQSAQIEFTRESDRSILENSRTVVKVIAAVIFFLLFMTALAVGIYGQTVAGALTLLGSALAPLLILRIHESRRTDTGRDIQIAEMIEEAAKNGGRIVVIVGQKHAERLPKFLSENLPGPDIRPPCYRLYSWHMIKELIFPGIVAFSVLFVVYSIIMVYIQFFF